MTVTVMLPYTIGLLDRRRFRKLLAEYGYEYTENRGLFDRVFLVKAEFPEHARLASEAYDA